MPTSYPGGIDSFTDPTPSESMNAPSHSGQHTNANDAIVAIENQLGTHGSNMVVSVFGRNGTVTATSGDYSVGQITGAAALASPTFTGVPAAPTASVGTNTTQVATTQFVAVALAQATVVNTSSTSYTLGLTDAGTSLQFTSNSAIAVTIPTHASVAFPVGAWVEIVMQGTAIPKLSAAAPPAVHWAGGTFTSGTTGPRAQYSVIRLLNVATDVWILSGDAA